MSEKDDRQRIYCAQAPSNIAFLKYWGKRCERDQWPANDSLSMTLSTLCTTTRATPSHLNQDEIWLNGQALTQEAPQLGKISKHLDYLRSLVESAEPLKIESHNSFPTGCGIASSASGLSALTLAALSAWLKASSLSDLEAAGFSRSRLAELARMGSGSACRSLWGGFVKWKAGESATSQQAGPLAVQSWPLNDTIVMFSEQEKAVGSTAAHRLAWSSPLFASRLACLDERLRSMEQAIEQQKMDLLGPLLEQEALEMHAVIMTANPPVYYFDQKVGDFLAAIRHLRRTQGVSVYFTMDAGSTVHLIYETSQQHEVESFLREEVPQCRFLTDGIGDGPKIWTSDQEDPRP